MVASKDKQDGLGLRLGRQIAAKRSSRSWTQAQLAERVGVDTETISRFERGFAVPSLARLQQLAKSLKTTMADLLAEELVKPDSESAVMSAWLSDLGTNDRLYAVKTLKGLCSHLRGRKA